MKILRVKSSQILTYQNEEMATASIFLNFPLRTPRKCKYYPFLIEKHKSLTYANSLWKQGRENLNLNKFAFFSNTVRRIGCFKDTARRAIPGVDGRSPLLTGYYRRRPGALKKCALFTSMKGFKVFGVQHQGWCATGPRAHVTYRKYGPSNRCRNGKGGPWANDVYRVYGKTLFPLV